MVSNCDFVLLNKEQTGYCNAFDATCCLLTILSGESPSSSASDVDNVNNSATADKVAQPKGVSSPQVLGNNFISVRTRPNFTRLLSFVSDHNKIEIPCQISYLGILENSKAKLYS